LLQGEENGGGTAGKKQSEWFKCLRFGLAGFGLAAVRAKPPSLKDASSSSNSLSRPLEEPTFAIKKTK